MPQPTRGPRLGGSPAHERLMLANLATSLFKHGKITTTVTKAKRLRPFAEQLITRAKQGDLASFRRLLRVIHELDVAYKLRDEIAPQYATRNGGYTRIIKAGVRKGDSAPMAVIELVEESELSIPQPTKAAKATARRTERSDALSALAGDTDEAPKRGRGAKAAGVAAAAGGDAAALGDDDEDLEDEEVDVDEEDDEDVEDDEEDENAKA